MRISDWSSDVCSSDLLGAQVAGPLAKQGSDAAGRSMDQHPVACLDRIRLVQQDVCGEALQQGGGGDLVADVFRQMTRCLGRTRALPGIGTLACVHLRTTDAALESTDRGRREKV